MSDMRFLLLSDLAERARVPKPGAETQGAWILESVQELTATYMKEGEFRERNRNEVIQEIACDVADLDKQSLWLAFSDLEAWRVVDEIKPETLSDADELAFQAIAILARRLCASLVESFPPPVD